MVRFRLVLSVTGLLAACAGGEGGGGPGPDLVVPADRVEGDTTALVVSGLSAAVTPGNTLAARVLWSTDTPASSALDLDCGEGWSHHLETSGLRTSHEVFLMGLWDGADCTATVTSITAEGLEGGGTVRFTAGPLPDLLPPLDLVVHDPQLAQPGWTVFNLSNHYDRVPLLLAVVDGEGRYRWYHRRATDSSGAATSVYVLPEGLLVGGTFDSGRIWPALIDWEGTVVWERELDMHHDLHPLADGTWLWLGHAETCPGDIPNGGTVNGYDPVADETTWTWSFCDHYTPDPVVKDWDHLNAVVRAPAGDGLLISAKNQNAIFKFDPGSGEVLWRLGQDGDFTRTDGDGLAFANQHAADFIAADRILLFDNGAEGWREESGAVELRIDEETRTFEVAWSWYPDPPVFAPIWSDADRLDNGNTLVTFGRRDPALDSHLIEVTPAGERVWHLVTPEKWGWYRAERIPPLVPGYVME